MAGPLSERGAQLLRGTVAVGDERGVATQASDQPGRAALAGVEIAGKVHAAHHALPRVVRGACQQLLASLGQHVGQ
ncbi:MAG TPA: hypothetical protein VFZ95_15495 [Steroidobacteraceae bacterium]